MNSLMIGCNYEQDDRKKNKLKSEQPNYLQRGGTKEGAEALMSRLEAYTQKYS